MLVINTVLLFQVRKMLPMQQLVVDRDRVRISRESYEVVAFLTESLMIPLCTFLDLTWTSVRT